MHKTAKGAFIVKVIPEKSDDYIARMAIEKEFTGDLEATSTGQMLSAKTEVQGSAGYVALERVAGTLHGRHGTFLLQHHGTMNRGASELRISVVPDSGTGDLSGLSGEMEIQITDGEHFYDFRYELRT
jgi:hypothetical protein